jgi:putative membrane protein insertion efficiency factor
MDRQNLAGMTSVALSAAVRGYQLLVSPLLPPACRFLPSCSEYAVEAIERHGARRGAVLALRRLARCHPWGGSGYDPVPGRGGLDCHSAGSGD